MRVFGKKRLPEIMDRLKNNIDSFRTGHLTTEDLPEILEEVKQKGIIVDLQRGTYRTEDK